jgi:large subunit ribosomal protein L32
MDCPQCGARKVTHHVCATCGTYNGNQILTIKEKRREAE